MHLPLRNARLKLPLGQLFWREVGHGPTLVFLHGSWHEGSQWLSVIDHLCTDYHCLAPDLLGFGNSEKPKTHYSIELEMECLAEYLESLHLRQVYLIGHSLGAWVATSYALKYQHQVQGLILLEPEGIALDPHANRWLPWLLAQPPILAWLLQALRPIAQGAGWRQGIDRLLQLRQKLLQSPTACQILFQRRRAEIKAEHLQERLSWLKVPTLILTGERDTASQPAITVLNQQVDQLEQHLVPDLSQDLPEVAPALVAQHIREFMR